MNKLKSLEIGRIIDSSLKVIEKLAKSKLADMDGGYTISEEDYEYIQNLIIKAREIRSERYWVLANKKE